MPNIVQEKDNFPLTRKVEKSAEEELIDAILEDQIEFGQNVQDLERYNKRAYAVSDSEDEDYLSESNRYNNDGFPSINVYHDIGPLSRELLKIKDEKALRKMISTTYMQNYWVGGEIKELSEDLVIGCIANKIPVTTLLYTLKLNTDRKSTIKSDIEYSQTSGSEDIGSEVEDEGEMASVRYEQNLTSSKESLKETKALNKSGVKAPVVPSELNKLDGYKMQEIKAMILADKREQNVTNIPNNFVIKEEAELSGEEIAISEKELPLGASFSRNRKNAHLDNPQANNKSSSYSPVLSQQPKATPIASNINISEEEVNQVAGNTRTGPLLPEPITDRRQSKHEALFKLFRDAKQQKVRKFSRDNSLGMNELAAKPPTGRQDSAKNSSPAEQQNSKSPVVSERNKSLERDKSSRVNMPSLSQSNIKQSLNSSINESEYLKNFKDFVTSIEKYIDERRKLKIVPYSKNKRKQLLKQIEEEMTLLTNMMKSRKDSFPSAVNDELFKRASKFHTEAINEKIKAKFLAYLIKEYGKSKDIPPKPTPFVKTTKRESRKRSAAKRLNSRQGSPENYMINIVETHASGEVNKRTSFGKSISTSEERSKTPSSLPRMHTVAVTTKKVSKKESAKKKFKEKDNDSKDDEDAFFYQSSSKF